MKRCLGSPWAKAAVVAGALAASALLYYLTRKEDAAEEEKETAPPRRCNPDDMSREDIIELLKKVVASQTSMKEVMCQLTNNLKGKDVSFDEAYKLAAREHPEDPIEEAGLDLQEFDKLLEKNRQDPEVNDLVQRIMGAVGPDEVRPLAHSITKSTIVELHKYMATELQDVVDAFHAVPNRAEYKMKAVTMAAQAMVAAKVEEKFRLASDDIEAAVLFLQDVLLTDPEFGMVNLQMQSAMNKLMGANKGPMTIP